MFEEGSTGGGNRTVFGGAFRYNGSMANKLSEYGEGRGRTGYLRDLRPHETMRLERATDPADPSDTPDAALARELRMERRTRTDEGLDRDTD